MLDPTPPGIQFQEEEWVVELWSYSSGYTHLAGAQLIEFGVSFSLCVFDVISARGAVWHQ